MRRAFSILELSISLAIAGIVVAAAASAGVTITRLMKLEGKKSSADQDARRLVEFLLSDVQTVGGGQVRPWMGLWVENDCEERLPLPECPNDSDRITLVDVDFNRGSCSVVAVSPTTVTFERLPALDGSANPGPCCYEWDGVPTSGPEDQYFDAALMFVRGRDEWAVRYATSEVDPANCVYGLSGINPLAAWSSDVPGQAPIESDEFVTVFSDQSTVTAVTLRTLYVDDSDPQNIGRLPRLMEWRDTTPPNGQFDAEEVSLVFPGVLNLQVALGYDALPDDGRITDTRSTADEWVGNAVGDTQTGMPSSAQRMASVGVITGVKAVEPGARTLQVLDGPSISNPSLILRRAQGRALLRNVAVFY